MLIATATLISLLLFGGPDEIFLIGALEKGIKKEIINKDQQKEIKNIISDYKASIKTYKKIRKEQKKKLETLFDSKNTSEAEFSSIYNDLISTLKRLQLEAIDARLMSLEKITDEEWENIIAIEKERLQKLNEKNAKGKNKDASKKPFSSFEAAIQSLQLDSQTEKEALDQIATLKKYYVELENNIKDSRNKFSQIIQGKNSTKADLEIIANWNNEIKSNAFSSLTNLYGILSESVPEDNWNKISKEFKKLIK